MLSLLTAFLPGLFKIGDKLIEDKDKKAEYAFKVQDMSFKMMEVMLNTKTYPFIDGLVKLSYASEQIIKGLFRPVVSAGIFIYGLMHPELIKHLHDMGGIGDTGIAGMFAAFPSWMYSRHVDKQKEKPTPFE